MSMPPEQQMAFYIEHVQPALVAVQAMLAPTGIAWAVGVSVFDPEMGEHELLTMTANVGRRTDKRLRKAAAVLSRDEE